MSAHVDLGALTKRNAERWAAAKLSRPGAEFSKVAQSLVNAKARYQEVEARTGVPWFVIAVIHEREASGRWSANICNGQPWNQVTTLVPKGRGPFPSFLAAAEDALRNCHPYASRWKDWSAGGALTLLEQYNGLGYAMRGKPSPYIWSGTNQYGRGKFVRDDVYSETTVDTQLGCAPVLKAMQALDATVRFTGESVAAPVAPATPAPKAAPATPVAPVKTSWLSSIFSAIGTALSRKPDHA